MLIIGHRGAPHEFLENGWKAFDAAIEAGSHRIELDVHLTRDHHLVIMHDHTLNRTTRGKGLVSNYTRKELESIPLRDGSAIPFLDEALEKLLPAVELNIEIKEPNPIAGIKCGNLIGKHQQRDKIIVSSFNVETVEWFSRNHPEIMRACLWSPTEFKWPHLSQLVPQLMMKRCDTKIFHPWVMMVDPLMMEFAHRHQWTVYPYARLLGPDEWFRKEGLWTRLRTMGVHGLCTNYPLQMHQWLEGIKNDKL
jgi:glycerophosphoryl diester phosphodiesterase